MSEPNTKIDNFIRALIRLEEGIAKYDEANDLLRDGIIQRFEFTFELAWKTLKTIFENEGLTGLNSPKTVLREAFSAGLINDEGLWLAMLRDRNSTTHIYSEQAAIEICRNIQEKYVMELESLLEKVKTRLGIASDI
ncbi:Nucleotidyltransferase [Desulfosporosinus sp. I2]|uniref:nucleotidyltransferase substrate binding protein n=1 Tax=Desulfosporosinus sp. I2 TaxID=1617025 RepID=UPI0005ED94DF|nr:nucleotidyltransferase substrate binding protein [Desulfosporosinus sp. I2]KJR45910.1 Nucleotidyltransferase [Desulfosporosinus sp. I2]